MLRLGFYPCAPLAGDHAIYVLGSDGTVSRIADGRSSMVRTPTRQSNSRCIDLDPSSEEAIVAEHGTLITKQSLVNGSVIRLPTLKLLGRVEA